MTGSTYSVRTAVSHLEWIVSCASEWMRLNEEFQSTHDLAAWTLAYELGDSAVRDRGIVEEPSALL